MKYVIFSDIHGNFFALDAMLKQVEKENVQGYIFCGDVFGYFYCQEEIIQSLSGLENFYAVMGNHEHYYIQALKQDQMFRDALAVKYGKSYLSIIGENCIEFLLNLPTMVNFNINGNKVGVVHGNMDDYFEGRIYPDTEVTNPRPYEHYDIIFCGHTHYRMQRMVGQRNTILINPGSLGQPRDGCGFSYCIYDFEKQEVDFRNVQLDKELLLKEMTDFGEEPLLISYIRRTFERGG